MRMLALFLLLWLPSVSGASPAEKPVAKPGPTSAEKPAPAGGSDSAAKPAPAKAPPSPPAKGSQVKPDDNFCLVCHTNKDQWDEKDPKSWRLYLPPDSLKADVHFQKGVNCHDCHGGNFDTDKVNVAHAVEDGFRAKPEEITKYCGTCHKEERRGLVMGVHAKAGPKDEHGRGTPLACAACHGKNSHAMIPARNPNSPVFLDNQVTLCGGCHEEHLDTYVRSVHGLGLYKSGLAVTPSCSDCHGAHGIFWPTDERSTVHPAHVAETCGKCHRFIEERLQASVHGHGTGAGRKATREAPGGNEKRRPTCTDCHEGHDLADPESAVFRLQLPNRCGNCHADLSKRYAMSLHGQLTELGYGAAAKCSDCHGAHDILPVSDPQSRLAPENRLETCGKCHPYAVANFTHYDPHANHHDADRYPFLHFAYTGMEILLFSVFGFFGAHALLWFVRSLIHTLQHGRPRRIAPEQPAYVRFEPIHRILHVIVIVSFLGLALTGLPLKYYDQPWAKTLASAFGGFDRTSVLHHICAAATIFYFVAHLVWMARTLAELRRGGARWASLLLGPDSPVPNFRDLKDLFRMARWFVGLGPKPVFERWSYWEKFDYWAVFWGVAIIGSSGLLLWFPNFFTRFLPGQVLNLAKIIHSEEALLATGFVFAIHFFNTHLRAEKFPLDMAVLTGLVSEEELREERPELLERLRREGKLDELRTTAPSRRHISLVMLGGFVALAVGLGLLAGMFLAGLTE